jgi:YebC/PmpR family DNA-binding regulatory protein
MAGHSKWSNIKRRKGAVDAQRGKVFTKLVREITTAARLGGADPDGNPRLRAAIVAARSQSMPAENVTRAVKKGAGDLDGPPMEDCQYEGYGPGGVALFIEAQTDNRNRTSADIRAAFNKMGGNLGAPGSVAWMFKKVGLFVFDHDRYSEEEVMDVALDAGADDVSVEDDSVHVMCDPKDFNDILDQFDRRNLTYATAELTMQSDNQTKVEGKNADTLFKLIDRLEDLDDVQKVHANFDLDDSELARLSEEA